MRKASGEGYMVLRPDPHGLHAARERIRGVIGELRLPSDEADRFLIAVGEAISNAYRHGTPDPNTDLIRLGWRHDMGRLVITIKDNGDGFHADPPFCPSGRPGSLAGGIELMRACADDVRLISDDGGKVVLHKRVKLIPEP